MSYLKRLGLAFALVWGASSAQMVYAYDGWSGGKIERIRIQSSRVLITQAGQKNPKNCANNDYLYLAQGDTPYQQNMYSALLTAYAAQKFVSLALKGCSTHGYPVISEVWIR